MIAAHRSRNIAALCIFIPSYSYLQSRYYKSSAFDRPIHFSVATLFIAGFALLAFAKYIEGSKSRHHEPQATKPALLDNLKHWLRSPLRPNTFACLVVFIVVRVILNWRITRTIHCSWDGLYGFLPFFIVTCDHPHLRAIHLPKHVDDDTSYRAPVVRFAALALIWGFAATDFSLLAENDSGVICPAGWCIERFVPLAQLTALFLDAIIILQISRLRQSNQDRFGGIWRFLGTLLWASAGIVTFLALWSYLDRINSMHNVFLSQLELRDVIADATVASVALVSGVFMLGNLHADLLALATTAITITVLVLSKSSDGTLAIMMSGFRGITTGFVVFMGFAALLHLSKANWASGVSSHQEHAFALGRYSICALALYLLVLVRASFIQTRESFDFSPRHTMTAAQAESDHWMAMATKSTSLESAVEEYRRRYGMPPPPNFDKWYEFAVSVNSPIIDTFDQINSDLLPFWGIPPAVIRERTTHLLTYPLLSMGGLLIQDGKTSLSPHVHGTHRWMVDFNEEMIKAFSEWLPDMQLAFNLDDECRISVPAADMADFMDEALVARSRLESTRDLVSFSQSQSPPWDSSFLEADENIWEPWPDSFRGWSKSPIYSHLIASTCPPDAPANKVRWWNRKARCDECASPHMENGFVRNWTLAGDLCHQPDLTHLHGFLTSPSALGASQTLFPVFSQSRAHNFADILYPSPWSFGDKAPYDEAKDIPWDHKRNSVYWRGAMSDGYAVRGSWQMFLRARFVHLASRVRTAVDKKSMYSFFTKREVHADASTNTVSPTTPTVLRSEILEQPVAVNVSFVGGFSRCDQRDCASEHVTFYGSASAEPPAGHDFQEGWQHRHLVDLDGAAFSGRFLPFVRSASLPYRAALFRTWWEERIHPWTHYVPLDLRLGDFWRALHYFAGPGPGLDDGRKMAEAGQKWAKKALRKEDMQVYMFRLLLEWGRVVDDRREELGFFLSG